MATRGSVQSALDTLDLIRHRLSNVELSIPTCELVPKQLDLARIITSKDLSWRLNRARPRKRCGDRLPWFWPLSLLPDVVLELNHPAKGALEATPRFFAAHHMLNCLVEPRRRFSDYFHRLALEEYPFVVVALASLHGKSRQLDHPRVSDRQLLDLSDLELRVADLVWGMTRCACLELGTQFRDHGVAAVCQHCGVLSPDLDRKYCSDGCMKAAERRRRHLRNTPSEP